MVGNTFFVTKSANGLFPSFRHTSFKGMAFLFRRRCLPLLFILFFLASCGGDSGGVTSGQNTDDSPGSLSFNLQWEASSHYKKSLPSDGQLQKRTLEKALPAPLVCTDFGVDTISAIVYDSSDSVVASDFWPCSNQGGTIVEVPIGTGYRVEARAEKSGVIAWQGENSGITVSAGQVNSAGTITMNYVGGDVTRPTASVMTPLFNVPVTSSVKVDFQEAMATSFINVSTFLLKSAGNSVKGTVSYDQTTFEATFTPVSSLAYFSSYSAILTTEIRDEAMNTMLSPFSWDFTTEADPGVATPSSPANVSASPADGYIRVEWDPTLGAKSYDIYYGAGPTLYAGGIIHPYVDFMNISQSFSSTSFVVIAVNGAAESPYSSTVGTTLVDVTSVMLPDTGQTGCYDSSASMTCPAPGEFFFGQDAQFSTRPLSYADPSDGTVSDSATALMWQQTDDNIDYTHSEAVTYCNNLVFAGYDDWSLPSRRELVSILNLGNHHPSIDGAVFPGTNSSAYWTSTAQAGIVENYWGVSFAGGGVYGYAGAEVMSVRCVRGTNNDNGNYTDSGLTVTDARTNLVWEKGGGGAMDWESALAYCEDSTLDSSNDWRLPDVKELESIISDSRANPSIEPEFAGTFSSSYWSSSTVAYGPSAAWCVNFASGMVGSCDKGLAKYVRCVR